MYRQPSDVTITTPLGKLKLRDYEGSPFVLMLLIFLTFLPLVFIISVWSFGLVFGLFGLSAPTLLETVGIWVSLVIVGSLLRTNA